MEKKNLIIHDLCPEEWEKISNKYINWNVVTDKYTEYISGDANGDGKVDIVDVTMTISHILGQKPTGFNNAAADVTGDGKIDIVDVTSIIDIILLSPPK